MMSSQIQQYVQQGPLTEADVFHAPMCAEHYDQACVHLQRLEKILAMTDEDRMWMVGRYTCKQAAKEQLARMTLVFRDKIAWHANEVAAGRRREDEEMDSMIQDLVDASNHLAGNRGSHSESAFSSTTLTGREQEIKQIMQEIDAENVDDIEELWWTRPPANAKIVPDHCGVVDIGKDLDWAKVHPRRRSEDDIGFHREDPESMTYEERIEIEKKLKETKPTTLERVWPPTPEEVARLAASTVPGTETRVLVHPAVRKEQARLAKAERLKSEEL